MPAAARISDPIGHTPAMKGLLGGLMLGLLAGAAIAAVSIAVVGTGGLAAVAIVGAGAAMGGGLGEALSGLSIVPKEVTGAIAGICSLNVFTNGLAAARAHVDLTSCSKHPSPPLPIATGSGQVFINGMPAARVDDKTGCGAVITKGSSSVFLGGGTVQTDTINPENLVPGWVHGALLVVGLGAGIVLAGPVMAVGGLMLGIGGGYAGNWAGGQIFGEGTDGQLLSGIVGSFAGGWLGAKGAPRAWSAGKGMLQRVRPGTVKANDFDAIYARAPKAKAEIDAVADGLAGKYGGRVAKAPIKSAERARQKIENDYRGDASKIKDLARNTIIVEQENVAAVAAELQSRGANVKIIDSATNPLGYSGVNATMKTRAGIHGEIQVNTPEMIYAKESPPLAKALLGDDVYDAVAARSGVEGGLGHKYYEQWRVLPEESAAAKAIASQSRDYYNAVRSENGH